MTSTGICWRLIVAAPIRIAHMWRWLKYLSRRLRARTFQYFLNEILGGLPTKCTGSFGSKGGTRDEVIDRFHVPPFRDIAEAVPLSPIS